MNESTPKGLHYHKLGHGPSTLLAFHGIGQDGISCFQPFVENLGDHYTIYAFDLFFHGESNPSNTGEKLSDPELITKEIWKNIIADFLQKNNIRRFDIAGFSMGGRFALATLESYPDRIDKAFLIAPDGVSEHPLYTLASQFPLTRSLFRWSMQKPGLFFRTAELLAKVGIVHSSLLRFTQHVLNTPGKRQTVYNSWVAFRKLHFDIAELYRKALANQVDAYLFIGKYDKLLRAENVKQLSALLPANKYLLLPSGHGQLVEKAAIQLKRHFGNI